MFQFWTLALLFALFLMSLTCLAHQNTDLGCVIFFCTGLHFTRLSRSSAQRSNPSLRTSTLPCMSLRHTQWILKQRRSITGNKCSNISSSNSNSVQIPTTATTTTCNSQLVQEAPQPNTSNQWPRQGQYGIWYDSSLDSQLFCAFSSTTEANPIFISAFKSQIMSLLPWQTQTIAVAVFSVSL